MHRLRPRERDRAARLVAVITGTLAVISLVAAGAVGVLAARHTAELVAPGATSFAELFTGPDGGPQLTDGTDPGVRRSYTTGS